MSWRAALSSPVAVVTVCRRRTSTIQAAAQVIEVTITAGTQLMVEFSSC